MNGAVWKVEVVVILGNVVEEVVEEEVVEKGMEEEVVEEGNLLVRVQVPVRVKATAVDCHRLQ